MDANTDKTTRCGTVSAERFSKSGSESIKKNGDININTRDIWTLGMIHHVFRLLKSPAQDTEDRPSDPFL